MVGIGGGVTSDIQINDADIHSPLEKKYRELKQQLMIAQLRSEPTKIPQPNCNKMMRMLAKVTTVLMSTFQLVIKPFESQTNSIGVKIILFQNA